MIADHNRRLRMGAEEALIRFPNHYHAIKVFVSLVRLSARGSEKFQAFRHSCLIGDRQHRRERKRCLYTQAWKGV